MRICQCFSRSDITVVCLMDSVQFLIARLLLTVTVTHLTKKISLSVAVFVSVS